MSQESKPRSSDRGFALYVVLATACAVFAYACHSHMFGLDFSGGLYWRALTLTIAIVIWIIAKCFPRLRE